MPGTGCENRSPCHVIVIEQLKAQIMLCSNTIPALHLERCGGLWHACIVSVYICPARDIGVISNFYNEAHYLNGDNIYQANHLIWMPD